MAGFLLDTNVLSEIRKGSRADANVLRWWEQVDAAELYLSVLCLGEIRYGIELKRKNDAKQSDVLEKWLVTTDSAYHGFDRGAVGAAEPWRKAA
jgi:toxin FitB